MKTINIEFYSYRPRLKVDMIWNTDLIPNVGDEIYIDSMYISQRDKKYFPSYVKSMNFRVKKRIWRLDKNDMPWIDSDVDLKLDWSEEESIRVEKYLEASKKERMKKK